VLLAYYIAAVNIEETFHGEDHETYAPFDGLVLTDTFQMTESATRNQISGGVFIGNSERADHENSLPIQVIISNPPYSVGQEREGDGDANERYEDLDKRMDESYRRRSNAKLTKSLNDSYIRAFRWASDRIGATGVVCFVSGGGWLIGNAMDGMRRCLVDEFAEIYVLDLRGNQRTTQGEKSRREGGKIFGGGSRTAVAITLLVKKAGHSGPGRVYYHDIGDYLTREEKLERLVQFTSEPPQWRELFPNEYADWVNQRRSDFGRFTPLGDPDAKGSESSAVFTSFSRGVITGRDAWIYSFSPLTLSSSMTRLIDTYEAVRSVEAAGGDSLAVPQSGKDIKWDGTLLAHRKRGRVASKFDLTSVTKSVYRPFVKEFFYADRMFCNSIYHMPKFFPNDMERPRAIVISGVGSESGLSCLMVNELPNLDLVPKAQVYPLFWYDEPPAGGGLLENLQTTPTRREGISTWAVDQFSEACGRAITREQIFYYTYGVLHSEDFRTAYEDNLVRERPRVPMVETVSDFEAFEQAGRTLADLHLNYEFVEPFPLEELCMRPDLEPEELFRVSKITFPKGQGVKDRPSVLIYNPYITLKGVPDEAWDYMISGKAALYWIVDRYQVKTDKESGIKNDPNEYSDDPRYILDLLKRVTTVSVRTLEIVRNLPRLAFD
jgi:predicted helicase